MNTIQQAIARARRRVYCQATLTALGWLALAGLMAGLVLVLIEHLLVVPMPLWTYGIVAGVVALLAPILAWTRRPSQATAATLIDERLQLKDRLGTALYAESLEGHPFAKQVVADAQQAASSARVNEAFPIRLTRVWGFVPVGAAVVAVAAVFLTQAQFDPFGLRRAKEQQQADAADAEQAERNIVEARALIRDLNTAESDEIEEADPTQVLKELASLTRRDLTSPQSKRDAMAKLSDVQEKLAAAETSKEREVQAMRNAMSRLDPGKKGPADRFADALRRGDYKAAAAELEALQNKLNQMSEKDKQALQQQLNNLKQQLQQQAQQQQAQQQQAQQQIQQQLQNAKLSQQQIQQLQQQGYNQQQVQQALQNQGMNQQQAQQMAQQIQQQQQQSQQSQSQSQCQNGLSQSLNQMAQSLGQQSQQNQQGQQQGQQNQQGQGNQQSQFNQGAWSAQQQLQQMSQMQNQLQQMQQAQSQLHNAMQNLQQGGGQNQQQQGGGIGGRQAGTGEGGHPLGYERPPGQHTHYASEDIQDRQGRVIASWYQDGEVAAGDATVEFDEAVTEARDNAERAVADDRVPRRYHEPVREYFKQLPDSPDSVGRAPAAPR